MFWLCFKQFGAHFLKFGLLGQRVASSVSMQEVYMYPLFLHISADVLHALYKILLACWQDGVSSDMGPNSQVVKPSHGAGMILVLIIPEQVVQVSPVAI